MSRSDIPSDKSPNFNARIRETLMTYLGKIGDPLDRGVTFRDLVDSGIVSLTNINLARTNGSVPVTVGDAISQPSTPDLTPPPTPTGFTATPAITTIILEHDTPIYSQGHGHLRTRVYGAIRATPNDPAPVFANATEITQFSGTVASYATNPSTTWHLWIKWESNDGVLSASPAGGTNGVVATTGQDVALLLDALTGEIMASQLNSTLSSRIDLIDAADTGLVTKVADLQTTYGTTASAAQSAADAAQANTSAAQSAADAAQAASDAVTAKSAALTAQSGAETAKDSAETAKTSAETAASSASTSATSASNSATAASNSASNAATSATTAANSATSAGNSASAAATSATNAATYATDAETASTASTNAKVAAESARDSAQTSATAAASSATTASTKASDAAESASAASTSATNAETSASNASTSATNASTSETNAATSASSASTSATAAANSATSAGDSATAAATSASTASTKASDAATSATSASTSATNAATSESNALTYKNDASSSASTATTKAADASTSAGAAATSATDAGNSATAAATSASTASTKATEASQSATSANTSATNASTSEANALTYKNDASSSASTATTKAADASTSAGAAATSAANAEDSAAAAAISASTASTKADESSQSAAAANISKVDAETAKASAETSATNAATSESNASGYATAASTALTQVRATIRGTSLGLPLEQWTLVNQSIVTLTDGKVGNKALRLSGIGGGYPNQGNFVPIDPTKKYRVKFWARPSADASGLLYFSLRQFTLDNANNPGPDNGGRSPYKPSGWSRANHIAAYGDTWGEYNYLWTSADWQAGVKFVQPEFLDNYSGAAGYWDVQGFTFTDASDIETVSAAVQTEASARASADGTLFAQYTVKIDNNGYVAGYGLASQTVNGVPVSSFLIRADRFSVVNPSTSKITISSAVSESNFFGSFSNIITATPHGLAVGDYVVISNVPEIVGQHQVTQIISSTQFAISQYSPTFTISASSSVALVTVPFVVTNGVTYIRTAMIQDATITNAKIGDLAVTDGKISSMGVAKLDAGSLKIGSYIQSSSYTAGSAGWRINANGTAEFNNVTARGNIYASGGTVGGITIDSVGLRSGQTAWNVGSGFYIGNDGKFSIGTPGSKYLTWDNSLLKFSGSLEAANGTFAGSLVAATGTFSGSLSAGVVDLSAVVGQSYTYATAGTFTVVTMPYAGTVRVKLVGGGGGGGGGRGNTDARTDYSGLSGSPGNQYDVTITNVPKDYVVKVIIGAGGAGGSAGAVGNAGNATYIQIYNASNVLQTQYSASGGAGGTHYRYNDNPDSGLSGSLVARANGHNFRFADAGDGAGWGSGQNGLAATDIPGSAGGAGGFYSKESMIYWGALTEARRADLNGGNGVRGGGGGGGMATRGRGFSNGGFIGYRSAVYDSSDGGAESNGGNGGDGYAFVEIFNPNGVVLTAEFQTLKTGLQADQSVGLYNWQTVFNTPATTGSVDVVATYGQGLYYYVYSLSYGVDAGVNGGTLQAAAALNGSGWSKPDSNPILQKRIAFFDENNNQTNFYYLRYIYKANFKVVGSI